MPSRTLSSLVPCSWIVIVGFAFASPVQAATITVVTGSNPISNGTNLQTALDSAQCGDTVVVQAGATYQRPTGQYFVLRYKGACTGTDADYITVTSSNLSGLPPAGTRVNPQLHAAAMAKIIGDSTPAITTEALAHHYKLIGLEITDAGTNYTPDLVMLTGTGSAPGGYPTYTELLSTGHFVVDRSFIHSSRISAANLFATTKDNYGGRGILAQGVAVTISNSYIAGFVGYMPGTNQTVIADNLGVYSVAGPGPLTIRNNYIEAWFNNIFLGGGGLQTNNVATLSNTALGSATFSTVQNLSVGDYVAFVVPSSPTGVSRKSGVVTSISGNVVTWNPIGPDHIEEIPVTPGQATWNGLLINDVKILNNTIVKPIFWQTDVQPNGAKMHIEIKTLDTGLIEGNVFGIQGASTGGPSKDNTAAVGMTVRNQNSSTPWAIIRNVTVRNNLLHGAGIITIQLLDNEHTATPGSNITVTNNLWTRDPAIGAVPPETGDWLPTAGGSNVTITHNTVRNTIGWSALDNLGPGTVQNGQNWGQSNFVIKDNIFDGGAYGLQGGGGGTIPGIYPPTGPIDNPGNLIVNNGNNFGSLRAAFALSTILANDAAVGFANLAGASAGGDYHGFALGTSSPYKGTASDGTDPGVNFAALDAALSSSNAGPPATPTNLRVR